MKKIKLKNKHEQPKKSAPKRTSKFSEKYRDRVEAIQNSDAKIIENRRIAAEIEKMERAKRATAERNENLNQKISVFNSTREASRRAPRRRK